MLRLGLASRVLAAVTEVKWNKVSLRTASLFIAAVVKFLNSSTSQTTRHHLY